MLKAKGIVVGTALFLFSHFAVSAAPTLIQLDDAELASTTGQALMSLSYLAPNDSGNLMSKYSQNSNIGFYKLGLEAEMDLNANVKNLQLGCGGVNGAGRCDIDIKNLSLSGLPTNYDPNSSSSPDFSSTPRASTSAKLSNPFIEFAIKNPDKASTREVAGLRVSAEKITGLLTAGINNGSSPSTTDGIQSLSGFMRIAGTTGDVWTKQTLFGKDSNQAISGNVDVTLFGKHGFTSMPGSSDTTGITVPSMNVPFTLPAFQVNGQRQTAAVAQNVRAVVNEIPIAAGSSVPSSVYANDQLNVQLNPCVSLIICIIREAKFKMGEGSKITGLNMDITFQQSLSMFHNIPLTGNGAYLALQSSSILWPGSYVDPSDATKTSLASMTSSDIAQKGWWMSFANPVQLGYLKANNQVDISAVLPQVAQLITNQLAGQYIPVSLADGIGALTGNPIVKTLVIPLNDATSSNPATLMLQNQQLVNQNITPNCYGGLKFC